MNIQTRKLNIIQFLINTNDAKILDSIESSMVLNTAPKSKYLPKRISDKEIIERAEISNKQYIEGKFTSQEALEFESKSWQ